MPHNNTIYRGSAVRIFVPEKQLGENSIKIESTKKKLFTEWTKTEDLETYDSIQRIIQFWKNSGITNDYLIYAKEVTDSKDKFAYEIVPYKKTKWPKKFKQLRVLWNMVFGGRKVSLKENDRILNVFKKSDLFTVPLKIQKSKIENVSKCAFCKEHVIKKQWVYKQEDDPTQILYNHAPTGLGKENHHFMVISKEHRPRFEDLTKEEFVAASGNTRRLLEHYQSKGCKTINLSVKVGIAGQTVPHWHQHVIPLQSKMKEFLSNIYILFHNIFSVKSKILPDKELNKKVENYRQDLMRKNM